MSPHSQNVRPARLARTSVSTASSPPEIHVEFISDVARIEALRDAWLELENHVSDRTVYISHDYIMALFLGYGGTRHTAFSQPLVCTVWQENHLVGVTPLFSSRGTLGKIPVRRLTLAGELLQAAEVLVLPNRPDILTATLRALAARPGWDLLLLNSLDLSSPSGAAWKNVAGDLGLTWESLPDHGFAVADLTSGYSAYAAEKGSNFRHKSHQIAEKIAAAGHWHIDRPNFTAGPEIIQRSLARMFAVAEKGWRAHASGIELERSHHPFYELLVHRFAPRGMVDLSILVLNGHDVAFSLAILEHGIYFHILIAFDEDYAHCSPGSFLLQEIFRALPARGIHSVVSHGEYEYKRRWATSIVPRQAGFIFARTLNAKLAHLSRFYLAPITSLFRRIRRPSQPDPPARPNHHKPTSH